jgi:hypothetical protein
MEPEGSLPFPQGSSTGPYPESDQSSSYHPILQFYKSSTKGPESVKLKNLHFWKPLPENG